MKETHKAVKRAAKERLIWSQRLGMNVDQDTGRPVLDQPGDHVRIAAGVGYEIFDYDWK